MESLHIEVTMKKAEPVDLTYFQVQPDNLTIGIQQ
jgi:hypothetical protein